MMGYFLHNEDKFDPCRRSSYEIKRCRSIKSVTRQEAEDFSMTHLKSDCLIVLCSAFCTAQEILRILLKQDTALLSHVSQSVSVSVTGVTSQVFSII